MRGFSERWKDLPDYIIGVTKEIWEDRGIETLNHSYAADIPIRTPMGVYRGNQLVIASTMSTIHEFPDRQIYADDVIYSGNDTDGFLSSHRGLNTATHSRDGQFGKATGTRLVIRVIADCAAKNGIIDDEWLIRDYGGIVRQLGHEPRDWTAELIRREGGMAKATQPFLPEHDIVGPYLGRGNDNAWGQRYAETLTRIMRKDFNHIHASYDRAAVGEVAGARTAIGRDAITEFWVGLRASFPDAKFEIHHQIGMDADMLSPRAALRWSLDGKHTGWGAFGKPSGARVHVMGLSHAEFGPRGLRREYALYDEVAIWKQILLNEGGLS